MKHNVSPFTDKKTQFVTRLFEAAAESGKVFNINPSVMLAQAAIESGWGESNHAVVNKNYFGIIACGKPNAYWHGGKSSTNRRGLSFRRYDTAENSFLDYGRLLRAQYPRAANVSNFPDAFALEISYSAYICDKNGDNREHYRRMLISIEKDIREIIEAQGLGTDRQRA